MPTSTPCALNTHVCECLGCAPHVRQANISVGPGPCRCSALLLLGPRDLEHPLFVPIGLQGVLDVGHLLLSTIGSVTMTSARFMSVRTTDLLCWRWWLEPKFRYWSVWVGLRYTVTCVLPSSLMFTQASRKGNLPSCSGSVVNLMLSSRLLRWVVNSSTWYSWIMVNVSSTYLNHTKGGVGAVRRAISSNPSIYRVAIMGDTGDPMAAPCFCVYITPLYVK